MDNDNDYDDTGVLEEDSWKEQSETTGTSGWTKNYNTNQDEEWKEDESADIEDFKEAFETPKEPSYDREVRPAENGVEEERIITGTERYYQKKWEGRTDEEFPVEPRKSWRAVGPGDTHSVNVGFGQSLVKMPREAWGAIRPFNRTTLDLPVSKIRFTHTGTESCTNKNECIQRCRDMQKYFMDLGFPDIPYNFMIGGDGIVYHGRGWMKQADRPYPFRKLRRTCVDVAYIGNFDENSVPYEMLSAAADFIKYGLKSKSITPFFQAYCFLGEEIKSTEPDVGRDADL